ncbi:MAG: class I SAM-dependent methyltransferase [Terrimicrobiaceae bacterium]
MHPSPDRVRVVPSKLVWVAKETIDDLLSQGTDCYRLASSPGCWVERFGAACLVSHDAGLPGGLIDEICLRPDLGPPLEAIYARKLVQGPGSSDAPKKVWSSGDHHPANHPLKESRPEIATHPPGDSTSTNCKDRYLTKEAGLFYEVDFSLGYSCGLFLDQRANRAKVRSFQPERVLNCFSFTCSFSVCGASVGARTTSLDLSKQSLTRGRRNFALNGLAETGHRFLADDVFDVLPRLARRGETFDVIILDPPTFSRGRGGRVFRAGNDLPALVEMALACAAPSAKLLVSTNCSRLPQDALGKLLRRSLKVPLRMESPEAPSDFSGGTGASTLWLSLRDRDRSDSKR